MQSIEICLTMLFLTGVFMAYIINEMISSGSLFWFCALAGTGMFLIQLLLNIIGMGQGEGFDAGDGFSDTGGADTLHNHAHHSAEVQQFKWLSLQAITTFLMMFGWTAITCQNQFGLQNPLTIGLAIAISAICSFAIFSVFKLANKLKSSGSIYQVEEAIGKEGFVYQSIPKGRSGKVSVSLQNFTHELNAISYCDYDLPSFTRVKIIEKINENTVVVTPL